MCEEAVIDSLVMFLWLFHDDIWSILTRLCVTTHRWLLLLWKQSVFWKISRTDVKCTTLPSCFFTFIILNVPSKPLIVSGRLNHSGYSLSLCKALWQSSALAQWLQSSSTAGHVCWRFFRLDEHLSATSLDHRTLRILIHLLFLTEPHVMKFVTQ